MESLVVFVELHFWEIFLIVTMILYKRFRWGALVLLAVQSAFEKIPPWLVMSVVSIIVLMEWYRWGETRVAIEQYMRKKTEQLENKKGEENE